MKARENIVQAAGCPVPGTTNRLILQNSPNIREINPLNYSFCNFAKYCENFVQAAGCPVPGTTNRLFLKKFAKHS